MSRKTEADFSNALFKNSLVFIVKDELCVLFIPTEFIIEGSHKKNQTFLWGLQLMIIL